jgi:hypothetical protein
MLTRSFFCLVLSVALLSQPVATPAFETDQYDLPPVPLADIGDEVSEYIEENLRKAVATVNAEIADSRACLGKTLTPRRKCASAENEKKELDHLLSNDAVARQLFKYIGDGNLYITKTGKWFKSHKFRGQPDRYKPAYTRSIFLINPADYLTSSPTVRLFSTEFGTDKIEHFLQQGYQYYEIYNKAIAKKMSEDEAVKKAIRWGQLTEQTYYGILSSGVYSNGDLYANYAGLKFYQGLTRPLIINGEKRPATVELDGAHWQIVDPDLRKHLIKPFISEHLNEAYNPSAFRFTLVRFVRRAVRKHACAAWQKAFPGLTVDELERRASALKQWNGENYGFTEKDRFVTIAEECF